MLHQSTFPLSSGLEIDFPVQLRQVIVRQASTKIHPLPTTHQDWSLQTKSLDQSQQNVLKKQQYNPSAARWSSRSNDGILAQEGSAFFGKRNRPSFGGSSDHELSFKVNPHKLIDRHVRHMGSFLEGGKNLALNKRGKCYVYVGKFLINIEVPKKQDSEFIIRTAVHWTGPTVNTNGSLDEGDIEYIMNSMMNPILGESMSVQRKGKYQIILVCKKPVPPVYEYFRKDVNDFVAAAEKVKAQLKSTMGLSRIEL